MGGGSVRALVDDLRNERLTHGRPPGAVVLLLQEVYRRSDVVPRHLAPGARTARAMRHAPADDPDRDIESVAKALGLSLLYVPSMRNGDARSMEDRGNAILSTLPLHDYTAIELPLERQRRVVVAATLTTRTADGAPLALRVASVHLTNMVAHHGWLLSEPGRTRQARALARGLDDGPIVIGGDLNTWFGAWDGAYREFARRFAAPSTTDHRPTFLLLRLDHFFQRLPAGWRFDVHRADDRYGSDHYPLIGELEIVQ
jgi:endonuclease/exonuclease/phosphatase family metal-dependent hydrolase